MLSGEDIDKVGTGDFIQSAWGAEKSFNFHIANAGVLSPSIYGVCKQCGYQRRIS